MGKTNPDWEVDDSRQNDHPTKRREYYCLHTCAGISRPNTGVVGCRREKQRLPKLVPRTSLPDLVSCHRKSLCSSDMGRLIYPHWDNSADPRLKSSQDLRQRTRDHQLRNRLFTSFHT